MPRHIELRNYRNPALFRMRENALEFLLGIVFADLPSKGLTLLKLGIFFRFKPPAVIVGNMPMKHIHLVFCKMIDNVENRFNALVVAPAVQKKTAILKLRPVRNSTIRQRRALQELLKLP